MHAEYVALSTSLRELIPIQGVMDEIATVFDMDRDEIAKVAKVWEDNEGALRLANSPMARVTPQSKHFAVKFHWFREMVRDERNKMEIKKIGTDDQKADIFTKGLARLEFMKKRKMLMGWWLTLIVFSRGRVIVNGKPVSFEPRETTNLVGH